MSKIKNKFLIKIIFIDKDSNTYKEIISYELEQAVNVSKGEFINPRGFSLDFGFDLLKVEEIVHLLYERDEQVFHSAEIFVIRVGKKNNPISRWTYQHENKNQ